MFNAGIGRHDLVIVGRCRSETCQNHNTAPSPRTRIGSGIGRGADFMIQIVWTVSIPHAAFDLGSIGIPADRNRCEREISINFNFTEIEDIRSGKEVYHLDHTKQGAAETVWSSPGDKEGS